MKSLGIVIEPAFVQVAGAWGGAGQPVAGPRGWVECMGSPLPMGTHNGRPVKARDACTSLLARLGRALGRQLPGATALPLGLAVPSWQSFRLRPRNDYLAAAREAGFHSPHVVPLAVAAAIAQDGLPEGPAVIVVEARTDGLELLALVKQAGRWRLATPPRSIPRLGVRRWVNELLGAALAGVPVASLAGHDLPGAERALLERLAFGGAVSDVNIPGAPPGKDTLHPDALLTLIESEQPAFGKALDDTCALLTVDRADVTVLGCGCGLEQPILAEKLRQWSQPAPFWGPANAAAGAARWARGPYEIGLFGQMPPAPVDWGNIGRREPASAPLLIG